ncbi:glycosyltransferase [Chloroflexota bacterium]
MKILQAYSKFYPSFASGGIVALAYQICIELVKKQHEVTFYTSDAIDRNTKIKDTNLPTNVNGITVYYAKTMLYNQAWKQKIFIMPQLINITKKGIKGFDVIHLHESRGFLPMLIHHYAKKYGVPYIMDTHGSLPSVVAGEIRPKWLLRRLFDIVFGKGILRDASKVIAENEFAVRAYKAVGIEDEKIALIPLFFPIEDFSELPSPGQFRNRYGIGERQVVMSLGRIHRIKGLDFLVESFCELSHSMEEAILVVVGPDDGYREELERLVSSLNLSGRVLFTGFLGGQDKLAALVDADVLVQPSRYEQAAWAPIEAVMCGTPIIVSKNTGSAEDVTRIGAGYSVEYGNKRELVGMIQRILEDPSEARTKVQRAKEYIRADLSLTERIRDYEKLYMECINETKR